MNGYLTGLLLPPPSKKLSDNNIIKGERVICENWVKVVVNCINIKRGTHYRWANDDLSTLNACLKSIRDSWYLDYTGACCPDPTGIDYLAGSQYRDPTKVCI